MAGAPQGNQNARSGTECRQALKRALARKADSVGDPEDVATFRKGLDLVMDQYVEAACEGDLQAIKDMIDRLDGKAVQGIELSGADGEKLDTSWTINVVEAAKGE